MNPFNPLNPWLIQLKNPPNRIFWFTEPGYRSGVETVPARAEFRCVTPQKSIADFFKYINKVGLDIDVEAGRKPCLQ